MAWTKIVGKSFSIDAFDAYCRSLNWTTWKPQFLVLHNTAAPSLAQRPKGFTRQHITNLEGYYRDQQKWRAGPHLFIDDKQIWVFTPLTVPGVHSPSWNSIAIGIEMLGDYEKESFTTGRGLKVCNNSVAAIASLSNALGLDPKTLRLHKEDKKTTHACPGKNVVKASVIKLVQDRIEKPSSKQPILPFANESDDDVEISSKTIEAMLVEQKPANDVLHVQTLLKQIGYHEVGEIDGIFGSRTTAAIAAFKRDWNQSGVPVIDAQLKTVLAKAVAEFWKRPIDPERKAATSAELAPKLPEVGAALTAERAGWWAAITTGASALVTGVAKTMGEAVEMLNPLKEFIADLPWPVWVTGALAVSVGLYFISRKSGDAANAATQAYQEGARV